MLPIVDKPLIQYAVEEAIAAGITDMIFVTGRGKRAIEDHFDKAYELEAELQAHGKNKLLKEVRGAARRRRHLRLHPPARGARPRPRGAVRAPPHRRRALRGDPRPTT
jgi:UTP-glucose-1-phosphate uridylyltransferase